MPPTAQLPRSLPIRTRLTALLLTLPLLAGVGAAQAAGGGVPARGAAAVSGEPGTRAAPALGKTPGHTFLLRLASLNILSSRHRPHGPKRVAREIREIKRQRATVVTFQEVEPDQLMKIRRKMPAFRIWPGKALGIRTYLLQIAWRKDLYRLKGTGTIWRMFGKYRRPIPYVKLQQRSTGRKFWVIDIHNSWGGLEHQRDVATRKEIRLIRDLRARNGLPLVIGADFNERIETCHKIARNTALVSANRGRESKPCPMPVHWGPDWIMGGGTSHDGFWFVRTPLITNNTDHRLLRVNIYAPR